MIVAQWVGEELLIYLRFAGPLPFQFETEDYNITLLPFTIFCFSIASIASLPVNKKELLY